MSHSRKIESECFYCSKSDQLHELMFFVDHLQVSDLYLAKDQAHLGRCILALHDHETEVFHLDQETLHRFTKDVSKAALAIKKVVGADKINYAIYGDIVSHLHFHLVPKFEGGLSWGEAFVNNPPQKTLIEYNEYDRLTTLIKEQLI